VVEGDGELWFVERVPRVYSGQWGSEIETAGRENVLADRKVLTCGTSQGRGVR
jgi:hypothetical protein